MFFNSVFKGICIIWNSKNGLTEVKVSAVIDFNTTMIFPELGEIIFSCEGPPTITGRLIFWQISSKNEVVQAVQIGWKAVITFGIIPHLHRIEKLKQIGREIVTDNILVSSACTNESFHSCYLNS